MYKQTTEAIGGEDDLVITVNKKGDIGNAKLGGIDLSADQNP